MILGQTGTQSNTCWKGHGSWFQWLSPWLDWNHLQTKKHTWLCQKHVVYGEPFPHVSSIPNKKKKRIKEKSTPFVILEWVYKAQKL